MAYSEWKDFKKNQNVFLSKLGKDIKSLSFDSYTESEKSWIVAINGNKYTFPKSQTILLMDDKIIQMPSWLYVNNFKENDNKKF